MAGEHPQPQTITPSTFRFRPLNAEEMEDLTLQYINELDQAFGRDRTIAFLWRLPRQCPGLKHKRGRPPRQTRRAEDKVEGIENPDEGPSAEEMEAKIISLIRHFGQRFGHLRTSVFVQRLHQIFPKMRHSGRGRPRGTVRYKFDFAESLYRLMRQRFPESRSGKFRFTLMALRPDAGA